MERVIIDCGYDLEVAHSLKGSLNGKMFYDPEKNISLSQLMLRIRRF